MPKTSKRSDAIRAAITVATITATAAAAMAQSASNGPQVNVNRAAKAASVINYWTPERMRSAKPMEVGKAGRSSAISGTRLVPLGPPGLAPGWVPGSGPQPRTLDVIKLGKFDLPMTSPPFLPPGTPTDFGNYAPFQRFTWGGSLVQYPVSTVGKLFFTQSGQNFVCSASVINLNTLATAGHCVHSGNNANSGWSTNLLFCPAFSPVGAHPTRGCWAGVGASTSFQWFNSRNSDRDYGCIVTAASGTKVANRIGNVTGWTGRAWNFPSRQATFAWGYPQGAPFVGNRLMSTASTEWYELNRNGSEAQLSKYIGNDMTGGSSGGPWWLNQVSSLPEVAAVDGSFDTDPFQGSGVPFINGINSHKRCTASGCPAGTVFTDEMGSPQFRNTAGDNNESEDVFAACFGIGGAR